VTSTALQPYQTGGDEHAEHEQRQDGPPRPARAAPDRREPVFGSAMALAAG